MTSLAALDSFSTVVGVRRGTEAAAVGPRALWMAAAVRAETLLAGLDQPEAEADILAELRGAIADGDYYLPLAVMFVKQRDNIQMSSDFVAVETALFVALSDRCVRMWTDTLRPLAALAGFSVRERDGRYEADDYGRFNSEARGLGFLFRRAWRGETCCHGNASLNCDVPRTYETLADLGDPVLFCARHLRGLLIASAAIGAAHQVVSGAERIIGADRFAALQEPAEGRLAMRVGGHQVAPALHRLLPPLPATLTLAESADSVAAYARELDRMFAAQAFREPYPSDMS